MKWSRAVVGWLGGLVAHTYIGPKSIVENNGMRLHAKREKVE